MHAGAERGQDHHLALLAPAEVLALGGLLDELDAHLAEAVVDGGVVDDLVGDPEVGVGELLLRLVRHLHRALDAPAEAVRLRELKGDVAVDVDVTALAHLGDETACG